MARPVENQMTISCLQCDWSVEATNASMQASNAFLEAAYAHVDAARAARARSGPAAQSCTARTTSSQMPPAPDTPDTRSAAAKPDAGIQTGFMDRSSREH